MTPQASEFDLPPHILDQIIHHRNGVTAEVKLHEQEGHEVIVRDNTGVVIHTCPQPCPQSASLNLSQD